MIPGDVAKCLVMAQTYGGFPATGLGLASFGVGAILSGVAASVSPAITEVDTVGTWRRYRLDITIPALSGVSMFDVTVEPPPGVAFDVQRVLSGEIEAVDLASIYDVIASPIVSVISDGGPSGDIQLRVVKNSYATVAFTVQDQAGNAIDLSGYTVPTFSIRSQDQVTTTYSQTSGITMTAGGLVTIAIPEGASFFSALGVGIDSISLYFSFHANEAGDAAKTTCLARGLVNEIRSEL